MKMKCFEMFMESWSLSRNSNKFIPYLKVKDFSYGNQNWLGKLWEIKMPSNIDLINNYTCKKERVQYF